MTTKKMILALIAAGMLGGVVYGAYTIGMNKGMQMTASVTASTSEAPATEKSEKKVLYWHDPMVPGHKFDKPGKSPFMDMDLVPVYAGEEGDEGTVSISPRVQQNLGIRTAEVAKSTLSSVVEAVGNVVYNERDVALVQARNSGFVERLYVRAPLDPVKKGQPLLELYVPEWVAAQEEYLSVRSMGGNVPEGLLEGARQRMRLVGMEDAQIRQVEKSGNVKARLTVTSPVSGVVSELSAREGMTVMAGAPLFRINGLNTVWVNAEVPESMAAQVKPGFAVEVRTPALHGTVLKGTVNALLPEINASTRTIVARVEVSNPKRQLVPGMFAAINFAPSSQQEALTVPTEAIIETGKRTVVMVAQGEGKFAPVDVEIGREANGTTEIRKGLEAGEKVVTSGQFLIDSEASLKGTTARLSDLPGEAGQDPAAGASAVHRGQGKVESIEQDAVTLSHGPIASLKWGEMTMGFQLPDGLDVSKIKEGDTVDFAVKITNEGMYQIVSIAPVANDAKPNSPQQTKEGAAMRGMQDDKQSHGTKPPTTNAPGAAR